MYDTFRKSVAPQTTKVQRNLNKPFPPPVGEWTIFSTLSLF